jgi:uncharacterized protein YgbK (DUF1537 family)
VVLDDDPTGTQTVRDVDVYLTWDDEHVEQALADSSACVYLSTNSRSLKPAEAAQLARSLGARIARAERIIGRRVTVASRSDSTLRGHFPVEVDCFFEGYGQTADGILIVPAFFEGGRYTFGDTHWVLGQTGLVPAAETEFARDPQFGYRTSDLRQWVEEKTHGRIQSADVQSVSLDLIRSEGIEAVGALFKAAQGGRYFAVNAMEDSDLEVIALALIEAERLGKRFFLRCAASIVKVYAGIEDAPLLKPSDIAAAGPGLVVIGSYVQRTTEQLDRLLQLSNLESIEVSVDDLAAAHERSDRLASIAARIDAALQQGRTAALSTSRMRKDLDGELFLSFGERIMQSLTTIVGCIKAKPAFVVAKGGITSFSVARDGLAVSRAKVLGQIAPGVPVWSLGRGARWEQIRYVVFPGNVGTVDALKAVVASLCGQQVAH